MVRPALRGSGTTAPRPVAPVVAIVVCDRPRIPAPPCLIAEVLASNTGAITTLVGDPPDIIIGSQAGPTFTDFLVRMAPIVAVGFVVLVLFARVLFCRVFEYHPERVAEVRTLREREAITDPRLPGRCPVVFGAVVIGFGSHSVLRLYLAIIALVGAGLMLLVSRADAVAFSVNSSGRHWCFFMGHFVIVASLSHTGMIEAAGPESSMLRRPSLRGGECGAVRLRCARCILR
ncbi:MAG TPA: SLC13 family permease [Amycolatopsis sp.]|nr:SLC13 family permease [Amycolatopsis sp.]